MNRHQAIALLTASGQPMELIQSELYGVPCRRYKNAPQTLRQLFEDKLSELPFIVFAEERYSFQQTWHKASALACALVEDFSIGKGDRVAICMRNYPEWIMAFNAITSIGAIAVALNSLCQADELVYGVTNSGSTLLIADQERANLLSSDIAQPWTTIVVRGDVSEQTDFLQWDTVVAPHAGKPMPAADIAPEDDAIILYTSGSTGHPKGVVSCNLSVISALLSWELELMALVVVKKIEIPVPVYQAAGLAGVPLFHATGCHAVFLASYRAQRKLVLMTKWDATRAAQLIEQERISSFIAPSAMTSDLVYQAAKGGNDLSSLAVVGGGGAARPPEQVKTIDRAFSNAMPNTGWGMTETNAIGTSIAGEDYLDHPASSGRTAPVLNIRIVDEQGAEQPAGKNGEVQVRGTSMFRCYWNNPKATADSHDNGWFKTGDVGYLDDEGFLFIVDRIKDMVIRGGENVGCGEVEAALLEHPLVREAAVYSVPDERLGEEVGATLFCDDTLVEAEALREFLASRIARFKIPRYLHITGSCLPRTGSGKIFKLQIRQEALARLSNSDS